MLKKFTGYIEPMADTMMPNNNFWKPRFWVTEIRDKKAYDDFVNLIPERKPVKFPKHHKKGGGPKNSDALLRGRKVNFKKEMLLVVYHTNPLTPPNIINVTKGKDSITVFKHQPPAFYKDVWRGYSYCAVVVPKLSMSARLEWVDFPDTLGRLVGSSDTAICKFNSVESVMEWANTSNFARFYPDVKTPILLMDYKGRDTWKVIMSKDVKMNKLSFGKQDDTEKKDRRYWMRKKRKRMFQLKVLILYIDSESGKIVRRKNKHLKNRKQQSEFFRNIYYE